MHRRRSWDASTRHLCGTTNTHPVKGRGEASAMDPRSVLDDLHLADDDILGHPDVCIAVLDGPVDMTHPCFAGADLTRLDTLVQEPAVQGPMSLHGTHVASVLFGQPGSAVVGMAPRCRGLILPVFHDD